MKKRILTTLLSLCILCSMAVPVLATPTDTSAELEEGLITVVGEPIGTPEDEDGILIEDEYTTFAASGLPFSMTGNGVTNLLTTRNSAGKNFTGGAFDAYAQQGLLVRGRLTHTQGKAIKVGACYYKSSTNTYQSVAPIYFSSQTEGRGWIPKLDGNYLNFNNSITYYGHMTNYQGSGSVSGTLSFSVSQRP